MSTTLGLYTRSKKVKSFVVVIIISLITGTLFVNTGPVALAAESSIEEVTFHGAGWGHGVGRSQWGSYGMAIEGYSYQNIISHYYSNSGLAQLADTHSKHAELAEGNPILRVSLARSTSSTEFRLAGGGAEICQTGLPSGTPECSVPAGLESGDAWRVVALGSNKCSLQDADGMRSAAGDCRISINYGTYSSKGTATEVSIAGFRIGDGIIRITPAATSSFNVSAEIDLEQYVAGITEVPSSWPQAALQTQAVAARSYAVIKVARYGALDVLEKTRPSCDCHLYASSVDQVFRGLSRGTSAPSWVAATKSTAGQVVVASPGSSTVAETVYSSSSGGATELSSDVWGSSAPSYLQSVDDHWALVSQNPYSSWDRPVSGDLIANKLGFDVLTAIEIVAHNTSGSASYVKYTGIDATGQTSSVTQSAGWTVSTFRLPSRYFTISTEQAGSSTTTTTTTTTVSTTSTTAPATNTTTTTTTVPPPTNSPSGPLFDSAEILRTGSRGPGVRHLQQILSGLGYSPGISDGIFGSKTTYATRTFQDFASLTPDGLVGAQTRSALYTILAKNNPPAAVEDPPEVKESAPDIVLRVGSRGETVRRMQTLLAQQGHAPGAADGIFGPTTLNAVLSFQKAKGLSADGVVGPRTLQALGY